MILRILIALLALAVAAAGVQSWRLHSLQATVADERATWVQTELDRVTQITELHDVINRQAAQRTATTRSNLAAATVAGDGLRDRTAAARAVGATTASTEWLYVGGCAQAQMMVTAIASLVGTSTVKAQACQGDPTIAGNWYDIPGAPTLSASASAAVVTAVFNIGAAKFMRLVPTAAATTATADTYELVLTAWE